MLRVRNCESGFSVAVLGMSVYGLGLGVTDRLLRFGFRV